VTEVFFFFIIFIKWIAANTAQQNSNSWLQRMLETTGNYQYATLIVAPTKSE